MIKDVDIKEATRFYNTCIFWVITLIPIAAYKLFYKIDIILIHNFILPIILLTSSLCIFSLIKGNLLFINRNSEFKHAIKYIKSLLNENNEKDSIENFIYYLDIFKIPYNLTNDKHHIYSEISKTENKLNIINKYLFNIALLLFLGLFIYTYCSRLLQ